MSYSDSEIRALARAQLTLPAIANVPSIYLAQLKEHLKAYPHDTNFTVSFSSGKFWTATRSDGQLVCKEKGCSRNPILLPGTGRNTFAPYQNHIKSDTTHLASRRARVQQKRLHKHMASPSVGQASSVSSPLIRGTLPRKSLNDPTIAQSASSSLAGWDQTYPYAVAPRPLPVPKAGPRLSFDFPALNSLAPRASVPQKRSSSDSDDLGLSKRVKTEVGARPALAPRDVNVKREEPYMTPPAAGPSNRANGRTSARTSLFKHEYDEDIKPAADPNDLSALWFAPLNAMASGSKTTPKAIINYEDFSDEDDYVPGDLLGNVLTQVGMQPTMPSALDLGIGLPALPVIRNDKDYDAFFAAAGNAHMFEATVSVSDALKVLGINDLMSHHFPGTTVYLLPHQALGVAWMYQQETAKHKGGILADEMGLGKTVQMIATIKFNPSEDPDCKTTLVIAPLALLEQWKAEIESKSSDPVKVLIYHGQHRPKDPNKLLDYDVVLTTYGTVVCEWPSNDVMVTKRRKSKAKKKKSTSSDDWLVPDSGAEDDEDDDKPAKKKNRRSALFQVDWYRVVLDEAQNIRNKGTRVSQAVTDLKATYRWCLTGTPITNTLSDAFGLLRFLQIRPWYDWTAFREQIGCNEKKNPTLAATRTQAIFRVCLLRRRKDSELNGKKLVELPPKEYHLEEMVFTKDEQDVYNMLTARSRAIFNRYLRQGTVLKNYAHVLVLLLRLRQCAVHPSLIAEFEDAFLKDGEIRLTGEVKEDAETTLHRASGILGKPWVLEIKAKLLTLALERMEAEHKSVDAVVPDECSICFEVLSVDAQVTPCKHFFCYGCLENVLNTEHVADEADPGKYAANERPCPSCRGPISSARMFHREAFMPSNAELGLESPDDGSLPPMPNVTGGDEDDSDDDYAKPVTKKGKGKATSSSQRRRSSKRPIYTDDDDSDDSIDDFIVQDDESETEKDVKRNARASKKGKGKKKMRIESESEYEDSDVSEAEEDNDIEMLDGEGKSIMMRKKAPKTKRKRMKYGRFLPSTKMMRMMELLVQIRESHPDDKTMIVSQWTSVLELCESYLTENGFKHVSYRGDMSSSDRDRAVQKFMRDDSVTVMLMSCKAGGVGLNLVRANHVISLDFAWSTAVENQAFDRLHRLGQTKPVDIHRLAIKNTVESKILDLQAKKESLANGSLGENGGMKLGRLSVKELANLFGLNTRGEVID